LKSEIVECDKSTKESTEKIEDVKQQQPRLFRCKENTKNKLEMLRKQLEIKNEIIKSNNVEANQSRINTAINSFNLSKENHGRDIDKLKNRNVSILEAIKVRKIELTTLEQTYSDQKNEERKEKMKDELELMKADLISKFSYLSNSNLQAELTQVKSEFQKLDNKLASH